MKPRSPKLTVLVLTKNESARLAACLESAREADEILVIDDESQDDTRALALAAGARVATRRLDSFAAQRNFAQSQAGGDWVFHLDADERLSPGLMAAIRSHLAGESGAAGRVRRLNFAFGRRHRFGPLKPDYVTRLFPRDGVTWEGAVHERPLFAGPVLNLPGSLTHLTYATWAQHQAKMDLYARLWAEAARARGRRAGYGTAFWRAAAGLVKMFCLNLGILGGPAAWRLCFRHGLYTFAKYRRLTALSAAPGPTEGD